MGLCGPGPFDSGGLVASGIGCFRPWQTATHTVRQFDGRDDG